MKKHPEHKIDALLHRSLHNLQGETSAQDWEEIRQRLQREQRDEPWFWFLGNRRMLSIVAFLLLSVAGIGYIGFHQSTQDIKQTASAENTSTVQLKANEINKTITPNYNSSDAKYTDRNVDKAEVNANSRSEVKALTEKNKPAKSSRSNFNISNRIFKANGVQRFNDKNVTSRNKLTETSKNSADVNSDKQLLKSNQIKNNESAENQTKASETAENLVSEENKSEAKPEDKTTTVADNSIANKSAKRAGNLSGKKFSFGLSFSPNFGGQTTAFDAAKTEQTHKNYYQLRSGNEKQSGGYKAGVFAQYYIWKALSLQTGIQYQQHREKAEYKFYNYEIPVIDSATRNILGYIEIEDTIGTNYSHQNTYSYTVIPLQIGSEFPLSDKWKIGLQAGGSAMFLSRAKGQTLRADDLTLTEINNLRKTNFSLTVSPAIYYRFQKYFSVGLEANYSQLLNPVQNATSTIQTKPWNIGAGINLRFNPF